MTHEVTLDGIHHSYHHQATWQNILSLPINDRDAPDPSEAGSSSRSSSRSDWSSNRKMEFTDFDNLFTFYDLNIFYSQN